MQGPTQWRVPLPGGQLQLPALRQGNDGLHDALSERALTHHQRTVVVLKRSGQDLPRRRRIAINQDHQGPAADAGRLPGVGRVFMLAGTPARVPASGADDALSAIEEEVGQSERLVQVSAGVAAQVQDDPSRIRQDGERGVDLRGRVASHPIQMDVADTFVHIVDRDRRDVNLVAFDGVWDRRGKPLSLDRHVDHGSGGTANALGGVSGGPPLGAFAIHAHDDVAHLHPDPLGRRGAEDGRHRDAVVKLADLDTDARVVARCGFTELVHVPGSEHGRVGIVQRRNQPP